MEIENMHLKQVHSSNSFFPPVNYYLFDVMIHLLKGMNESVKKSKNLQRNSLGWDEYAKTTRQLFVIFVDF